MSFRSVRAGTRELKVGESLVRLRHRRPTGEEMLATLAMKVPGPDSQNPAMDLLRGNLELGFACLAGIPSGELVVDDGHGPQPIGSDPGSPDFSEDWKELVRQCFPLLLIALGQHLSTLPALSEERKKK